MKIEKILVQIVNKNHAMDVLMLVEKIDFLQEIRGLRDKWGITALYDTFALDTILQKKAETRKSPVTAEDLTDISVEFNNDVDKVLKKFHRGLNFKRVVEDALVTGTVPDGIYKSCYFDVVAINEPEDLNMPERFHYAIVMSPRAKQKDVIEAFKDFQRHIFGDESSNEFETGTMGKINFHASADSLNTENPNDLQLIEQYHRGNIYESSMLSDGNRRDLDKVQEWYWMRFGDYINGISEKPKTYEDVAEEWNKRCPHYPTNNEEHNKKCIYCRVDGSYFAHALVPYEKLLEQ